MLNEERVKHMVRLALYETKNGKKELKAGSFYKKDYIALNMFWSVIWMTLGYIILVLLLMLSFMSVLVERITVVTGILLIIVIVAVYVGLLFLYIIASRKFYGKRHARAYDYVKDFEKDLAELEVMYEKEDINGEDI